MYCPNSGCKAQAAVGDGDGCGKEVDNWLKQIAKSVKREPVKKDKNYIPPSARRMVRMDQLPAACRTVLNSPAATAVAGEAKIVAPEKSPKKK